MKRSASLALLLCILSIECLGHQDKVLSLHNDGDITGLPERYSPAVLKIERSGGSSESLLQGIQMRISANTSTLPPCVVKRLNTRHVSHIGLTASWYHDLTLLPPYINVDFYDTGYDPHRWENPRHSILFNLNNAKVVRMTYSGFSTDESRFEFLPIDLSSICDKREIDNVVEPTSAP